MIKTNRLNYKHYGVFLEEIITTKFLNIFKNNWKKNFKTPKIEPNHLMNE